jgi:hypothetical protein
MIAGESVAGIGFGPIWLLAVAVAKRWAPARSCGPEHATEMAIGRGLGADRVININDGVSLRWSSY